MLKNIINRASVYERHIENSPIPFPDYKLPIQQSLSLQSIPYGCELLIVAPGTSVASKKS